MRTPVGTVLPATDPLAGFEATTRAWFEATFPDGPTPAQRLAWPVLADGGNALVVAPTGGGKTLAAFLAVLDRLVRDRRAGRLDAGVRCVYVSPLRSLSYDIERNLARPLASLNADFESKAIPNPIRVGVRTGDTPAVERARQRLDPPHILITTPESLSLLLSQEGWTPVWRGLETIVVDEAHALAPNKRGADLAVTLERLASFAERDPARVGLSATCRPAEVVARYVAGVGRGCVVLDAATVAARVEPEIRVESLLRSDEAPHRGLTYRRLLIRLARSLRTQRTTVIFSNTRAFAEKLTHDLRRLPDIEAREVAAHHSALDARRRREVERALMEGGLRGVVTSTSLELGVDIGTADETIQIGLPGGSARLLQRVGRSGHAVGRTPRGVMLATTPAELAGAVVTADAARHGRIEPLAWIRAPLDVLCQQLVGMACERAWRCDDAFALIRRAAPMSELSRDDFDACLAFLAGELGAAGAEPAAHDAANAADRSAPPRWTSPRIRVREGLFEVARGRVRIWLRANVGTIAVEESSRVLVDGLDVGTLESAYADTLTPGDRFVLDGRCLELKRREFKQLWARAAGDGPALPRWTSDRQGLSNTLAAELAGFRDAAARTLLDGPAALRGLLIEVHGLEPDAASILVDLFESQQRVSEVPGPAFLLVERSPGRCDDESDYSLHHPLGRRASEALGRAVAARLGREVGRDISLSVADMGFSLRVDASAPVAPEVWSRLLDPDRFEDDVYEGVDRGELPSRRFRHVAATALMILRNPEPGRVRVGGTEWVSRRLFPMVQARCPRHPLLRETRREILDDLLDAPAALAWVASRPEVRVRSLAAPSPFTRAWIDPSAPDLLRFEPASAALRRLSARLMA